MYNFLSPRAAAYLGIGAGWDKAAQPTLAQALRALQTVGFDPLRPVHHSDPLRVSTREEATDRVQAAHAVIVPLFLPANTMGLDLARQEQLIGLLEHEYGEAMRIRREGRTPGPQASSPSLDTSNSTQDALRHAVIFLPAPGTIISGYDRSIVARLDALVTAARQGHGDPNEFDPQTTDLEKLICATLFRELPGLTDAVVMLSSTLRDLEDEREALKKSIALLGQRVHKTQFRTEPFEDRQVSLDPEEASLRFLEESTIYLGLLRSWTSAPPVDEAMAPSYATHRSYTELEFEYASRMGMLRAFFFGDPQRAVRLNAFQELTDDERQRTDAFIARIKNDGGTPWREFETPDELQTMVFELLGWLTRPSPDQQAYPPPHPNEKIYVAHPYLLLADDAQMVRGHQRQRLESWWNDRSRTPCLVIEALGGMGKSALAWTFFQQLSQTSPSPKRVWWSFYAKGSGPRQFAAHVLWWITPVRNRALARAVLEEDGDRQLFEFLLRELREDGRDFLFVLDGIERVLNSYDHFRGDIIHDEGPTLDLTLRQLAQSLATPSETGVARCPSEDAALRYLLAFRGEDDQIAQQQLQGEDTSHFAWFLSELCKIERVGVLITSRFVPTSLTAAVAQDPPRAVVEQLPGLNAEEIQEIWTEQFGLAWETEPLPEALGGGTLAEICEVSLMGYALPITILGQLVQDAPQANGSFRAWKANLPEPLRSMPWAGPETRSDDIDVRAGATNGIQSKILLLSLLKLRDRDADWSVAQEILRSTSSVTYSDLRRLVGEGHPFSNDAQLQDALLRLRTWKIIGSSQNLDSFDTHPIMRRAIQMSDPDWSARVKAHIDGLTADWKLWSNRHPAAGEIPPLEELEYRWRSLLDLLDLGEVDAACDLYQEWIEPSLRFRTSAESVLEVREAWLRRALKTVDRFRTLRAGGLPYDLMEAYLRCQRADNFILQDQIIQAAAELDAIPATVLQGESSSGSPSGRTAAARSRIALKRGHLYDARCEPLRALQNFLAAFKLAPLQSDLQRWSLCGVSRSLTQAGHLKKASQALKLARICFGQQDADIAFAQLQLARARGKAVAEALRGFADATVNLHYGRLSYRVEAAQAIVETVNEQNAEGETDSRLPPPAQPDTAQPDTGPQRLEAELVALEQEASACGFLEVAHDAKLLRYRLQAATGKLPPGDIAALLGVMETPLREAGALKRLAKVLSARLALMPTGQAQQAVAEELARLACRDREYPDAEFLRAAAKYLGRSPRQLLESFAGEDPPSDLPEYGQVASLDEFLDQGIAGQRKVSDTRGWTEQQLNERLERVKELLSWDATTGSARKWWSAFEAENQHRRALVLRLAEELMVRESSITEFFLAYIYSNTDNIQSNLEYHDFTRLKKQEETYRKHRNGLEKLKQAGKAVDAEEFARLDARRPPNFFSGVSPGPDAAHWTRQQIAARCADLLVDVHAHAAQQLAQDWWKALEAEQLREADGSQIRVLRILEELAQRKATLQDLHTAYVHSNTENLLAVFHFLDYTRFKKQEEERKKQAAQEARERAKRNQGVEAQELWERLLAEYSRGHAAPSLTPQQKQLLRAAPPENLPADQQALLESWIQEDLR